MKLIDLQQLDILNYSSRNIETISVKIAFNHILDMNAKIVIDAIEHEIAKQLFEKEEVSNVFFNIEIEDLALAYAENKQVADIVSNCLLRVITQPTTREREKRLNMPPNFEKIKLGTRINILNAINYYTHVDAFNAKIIVNKEAFYFIKR